MQKEQITMNQNRNIYIILSYSGTFPAKLIRAVSQKEYSHASISLDKRLDEFYSFGRKKVNNPLISGFVIEKKCEGVYKKYPMTYCKVLRLEVTNEVYQRVQVEINNFLSERGRFRYSFMGLLLAGVNIYRPRKYYMYCSEFVRLVLSNSGIDMSTLPKVCRPCDFFNLPNSSVVYTGLLNKYSA